MNHLNHVIYIYGSSRTHSLCENIWLNEGNTYENELMIVELYTDLYKLLWNIAFIWKDKKNHWQNNTLLYIIKQNLY